MMGRHTASGERHAVRVDVVLHLSLSTKREDGHGHDGDNVLDGRHIEQLIIEREDDIPR